ncbi:MAG: NlpC/P60 family protein [Actinomycetota bacterium]|nr:NlpC/P60 family protein [Actinomycetota bacterium]
MPRRRTSRTLAAGAVVLALLAPCLPAGADPGNPTPAEIRAANARVAAAKHRVASLQEQAEHAAEAYNGALVRSERLTAASIQAAGVAAEATQAYDAARDNARVARSVADAATARAHLAELAQLQAQAEAHAAQRKLDRIAIGAFQTGGKLGMVSQLFLATDPIELANARNLMNHVGVYQDKVIAAAVAAKDRAKAAAAALVAAKGEAVAAADEALAALTRAESAKTQAEASRATAHAAASGAAKATRDAGAARLHALALVARAQAALGTAVRTKKQLEAAARAAKADAAKYQDIDAPSNEARIAIHWAFEEIGVPYAWGGGNEDGPSEGFAQGAGTVGFDCSGLTLFSYHKAGIGLDHYTGSQWQQGQRISSRADLLPGDLMFFAYDPSNEQTIHHVSIYIGKGKMIEAPYTGEVVRVSSADRSDFIGATRPWA